MRKLPLIIFLLVLIGLVVGIRYSATNKDSEPPALQISDSAIQSMNANLVGIWRLQNDPTFTREIKNNGEVVDRYKKTATTTVQTGAWRLFTQTRLPPDLATINALTIRDDTLYLQFVFGPTAFNFSVLSLSEGLLTLGYLDRKGRTTFEKVQ